MRLSVIVPHHRQARFLAACLDSLLRQTRAPDEIILVDSSPTETGAILAPFGTRIRHLVRPATGVAAARNAGAAVATGDLLAFLDADNLAVEGRLALQQDVMIRDRTAVLCHGALRPIDRDGRAYAGLERIASEEVPFDRQLGWLIERNRIATDTVCLRRSWFERLGGFCEEPGVREDYDLWLRLAALGPFRYLPRSLALYRRHETNLSNDQDYLFGWEAGALRRVGEARAWRAILRAFPDEPCRTLVGAEWMLRAGWPRRAEVCFRAAAVRWPDEPAFAFHLVHLAIDAGRLEEAEQTCRRLLDRGTDDAALWNNLGVVLARRGERPAAAHAFDHALVLRPRYADAASNAARIRDGRDDSGWRLTRRRLRPVLMPLGAVA